MNEITLNDVNIGDKVRIIKLGALGGMRRRLLDIGLTEGTKVECIGRSPGGDPTAFLIRNSVFAIRSEDCKDILVRG